VPAPASCAGSLQPQGTRSRAAALVATTLSVHQLCLLTGRKQGHTGTGTAPGQRAAAPPPPGGGGGRKRRSHGGVPFLRPRPRPGGGAPPTPGGGGGGALAPQHRVSAVFAPTGIWARSCLSPSPARLKPRFLHLPASVATPLFIGRAASLVAWSPPGALLADQPAHARSWSPAHPRARKCRLSPAACAGAVGEACDSLLEASLT